MNALITLIKALIISAFLTPPAYAYVDGGTALFVLQGFFAALGAFLMFLKSPWRSIVRIFSRKKQVQAAKDANDA
ncbi:MAG: hypothetical protein O9331_00180 [Acidovorax sp.]|nr:hypothetical protein [Roseateles sp.]MCZ8085570.1 hypothetical protein [Paracoccaceae bacterium]MCZ8091887.1 hypothetical protein [Acidovorax sp.]MCZ8227700.1 hypothetical protein [Burkholderiaceae bacterium]